MSKPRKSPISSIIELNSEREEHTKAKLSAYLGRIGQQNLEANVDNLLSIDKGYADRFTYINSRIGEQAKQRILISGSSAGSEMIVARKFGWQNIYGTEVDRELAQIAAERFVGVDNISIQLYDGVHLPFADNFFSMICSGHIIEHTLSPYAYFSEHLRVLQPGGYFFLEFPDRYHRVELHTSLPSVEYLPMFLRNLLLRYRSSHFSNNSDLEISHYRQLLHDIHPMSVWQIKFFMVLNSFWRKGTALDHKYSPAPGYKRMMIKARN